MKNFVVFVGMMGCGKTTIGSIIGKRTGINFVDVDLEIEKDLKMSVSEIFNEFGEQYFRKIEKQKIFEYVNEKNLILSLGGGAFEDEETRNCLKKCATVIYLKASPSCLFNRIKNSINRPLLHKNFSVDTIAFILKKRIENYEKAHFTIDTCQKSPDEIVNKILRFLK